MKNEINKITKISEMEATIKTKKSQEIPINWADIINLMQIMIFEEPGYEYYIKEEGEKNEKT